MIPRNNTFLRFSVCQCCKETRCYIFVSLFIDTKKQYDISSFRCVSVLWGEMFVFLCLSVSAAKKQVSRHLLISLCEGFNETGAMAFLCFRVLARGERERLFPCVGKGWERASIPNSKHWFTTSFHQPLPYLFTPQGPENCQLTNSFFAGARTVVSLLQTTQIISDVCFTTDHVAYAR